MDADDAALFTGLVIGDDAREPVGDDRQRSARPGCRT